MPTTIAEYGQAIDRLPDDVTAALRAQAKITADFVAKRAAEILRSKTHGTGHTAASIHVEEQADRKQFLVVVPDPLDHPRLAARHMKRSRRTFTVRVASSNLPIWLEYGTRFMTARAFMRPARDEASAAYQRDMERAAVVTVTKALT